MRNRPAYSGIFTRRLVLPTGAIVCALLAAELFLRLTGYEGDFERRLFYFASEFPVIDRASWVLRDAGESRAWRARGVLYIRDTPVPIRSAEERVLFLGDSVTYGWGLPENQAFPARFARETRTTVLNAGVYGFSTCDELRLYRERLRELRPRLVVLGVYLANDLNYNVLCGERVRRYPRILEQWRGELLDHSALAHFAYLRAQAINARMRWFTGKDGQFRSRLELIDSESGLHFLNYRQGEVAFYRTSETDLVRHAYELLGHLLGELRDSVQADGGQLLVLLLPAPATVVGEPYFPVEPNALRTMAYQGLRVPEEELDVRRPPARVRDLCASAGLSCLDLTEALRPLGRAAYQPGDDHLSVAGHQAVAEFLTRQISIAKLTARHD